MLMNAEIPILTVKMISIDALCLIHVSFGLNELSLNTKQTNKQKEFRTFKMLVSSYGLKLRLLIM